MAAAQYNIIIEEANVFSHTFTWFDKNGEPVDLTGYHAIMYIKENRNDEVCFLKIDGTTTGIVIIDQVENPGMVHIGIPASLLEEIPFEYGFYQLDVFPSDDAGNPIRLVYGRVAVERSGKC